VFLGVRERERDLLNVDSVFDNPTLRFLYWIPRGGRRGGDRGLFGTRFRPSSLLDHIKLEVGSNAR
jgi:hypothetical protein